MEPDAKEFFIHRQYLNSLDEDGREAVKESFPNVKGVVAEDWIGLYVSFKNAEAILKRHRRDGVSPNKIREIMESGALYY